MKRTKWADFSWPEILKAIESGVPHAVKAASRRAAASGRKSTFAEMRRDIEKAVDANKEITAANTVQP